MENVKIALIKALIILVPSYATALITDKMVYVIPMLAASGMVAATLSLPSSSNVNRRVDEDDTEQEVGAPEATVSESNVNEFGAGG